MEHARDIPEMVAAARSMGYTFEPRALQLLESAAEIRLADQVTPAASLETARRIFVRALCRAAARQETRIDEHDVIDAIGHELLFRKSQP